MAFSIDINESGLSAMRALANPSQFVKDIQAGLRYATPGLKKIIAKEIGTKYALSAERIKDDIREPRYDNDSITVKFNRVPPSLRAYGGKPLKAIKTKRGVGIPIGLKYKVFKGKQEKRDSVFWLQLGNVPFPGIPFKRVGPASTQIEALYGPSIGSIFTGKSQFGEEIREKTVEFVQIRFIKGVERSFDRRARGR